MVKCAQTFHSFFHADPLGNDGVHLRMRQVVELRDMLPSDTYLMLEIAMRLN